jgi:hypothetical protein
MYRRFVHIFLLIIVLSFNSSLFAEELNEMEGNLYYQNLSFDKLTKDKQIKDREYYSQSTILSDLENKVYTYKTPKYSIDYYDDTVSIILQNIAKGGEPGAKVLIKIFETKKDYSPVYTNGMALYALGYSGTTIGYDYLVALAQNPSLDPSIRVSAAISLPNNILWYTQEQKDKIFSLLIENLNSNNQDIKPAIFNSFITLKNINAIPYLEPYLNDTVKSATPIYQDGHLLTENKQNTYPVRDTAKKAFDYLNNLKTAIKVYKEFSAIHPDQQFQ